MEYNHTMALGNSQNSSNVPPELAPYYNAPSGSRLVGRIIRIFLLLVAIFLAIFALPLELEQGAQHQKRIETFDQSVAAGCKFAKS